MTDDVDFAKAFESLSKLGDGEKPPADMKIGEEPAPAAPAAASSEPEPPKAEEPAAPPPETPEEKPEEPAAPPPAEQKRPAPSDELLERFAAIMRESAEQPPPQQQQQQPPAAPDVYSDEEKTFLQSYEKDWPDIARAEALRRRGEYRDLIGYVFSEFAKEIRPLMDQVRLQAERTHLSDLQTRVEDYSDIRDKVVQWAAQQPPYLQSAYQHVIQYGTIDEVQDLIDRYRRDNAPSAKTAAPPPSRKAEELTNAAKQAAESLAPVNSKRSAVIQTLDPSDFESAFESFARD